MKRALITLTTISALVIPLGAQEPVDLTMIERIKDEGIERSEVMEHFNYLTNVIGPRLSATPAYKRAADWGVIKFEEWGLENAHLESWDFGRGWTLEGLTLEMRSPRYF
ncbi:MAG TPA: peptidase M28, partial [Gemmatimonadetes bacterium]|nr:peptidase M28 [Gemmatimonadota bacterium]